MLTSHLFPTLIIALMIPKIQMFGSMASTAPAGRAAANI